MEMPDMLGEIRDLNLTYLMLAQQMIRDDKSAAVYRRASGDLLVAHRTVMRAASDAGDWLVVRAQPEKSGTCREDDPTHALALLQATLEATADGILLLDRDGAIRNMNRRFAGMWRLPEALLAARDDNAIFEFMAGLFSDSEGCRARLAEIARDEGRETCDFLHLADGRSFECKSMPAGSGTQLIGRVFSFTDITGRKRAEAARALLEAQLAEAQKMEAIGTLAGGIAHDFNNIIAAILGNTELARRDASANPQLLDSLEEIRRAGNRGRDLVRQILSFSRRQATAFAPLALCPVIDESVRLLRATLPLRLKIAVHCDPDVPAVLADATQIEQVVLNLATNAMQAMRDCAGRIDIRLDTVVVNAAMARNCPVLRVLHEKHPGRTVRLTVSDTGPGMDAVTLARIFEPFFTTKGNNEGTGLGLSVVHGIVRAHQGAIDVESQPGKGTKFTVYLPATALPGSAASPAAEPGAIMRMPAAMPAKDPDRSPHILYLDDDESLVYLVQRLLERGGYRVSVHTDQIEALAALRAAPASFDLLLSDYNMPGMSGLEVARAARAIRADLPVAVASGFVDETLSSQATEAGVVELIFKADAVEDFCAVVARLVQTVTIACESL